MTTFRKPSSSFIMLFTDEYPIRPVGAILFGLDPVIVDYGLLIYTVRNCVGQDSDCV